MLTRSIHFWGRGQTCSPDDYLSSPACCGCELLKSTWQTLLSTSVEVFLRLLQTQVHKWHSSWTSGRCTAVRHLRAGGRTPSGRYLNVQRVSGMINESHHVLLGDRGWLKCNIKEAAGCWEQQIAAAVLSCSISAAELLLTKCSHNKKRINESLNSAGHNVVSVRPPASNLHCPMMLISPAVFLPWGLHQLGFFLSA